MKYRPDRLPFEVDDGILSDAIRISSAAHDAVDKPEWTNLEGAEKKEAKNKLSRILKPKEQLALYKWARDSGKLLNNSKFSSAWKEDGRRGETENEVYFDEANLVWMKRNDLSYHDTYLGFFQRIAIHNRAFPEAPLTLVGFVVDKNRNLPDSPDMLKPVISQPHIQAERGAEPEEVERVMTNLGYEKVSDVDYYHPELHIRVEDLHNENVFFKDGDIFVIDPVIFLDERGKELRLSGSISDATAKVA
jgi:hypothetical protein